VPSEPRADETPDDAAAVVPEGAAGDSTALAPEVSGEPATPAPEVSGEPAAPDAAAVEADGGADVAPAATATDDTDAAEPPIPSEDELERTATPATVRRAPKFSAFITFGALGGMVVGLLLTAIVRPENPLVSDGTGFISFLDGEGAVRTVMVVAVGVLGGFVGGALAARADRRSGPPRRR